MAAIISSRFREKKNAILDALSVPDADYSDLSPKGSVDEGIRELIDEINQTDGLVTTSSCAGRISVFLEGAKTSDGTTTDPPGAVSNDQVNVPGGKGLGGRWLFVSHDDVDLPASDVETPLHDLFQLRQQQGRKAVSTKTMRFVRFQFEPMILHVMAATLKHAQHVLSAALNAGFRESGVQSLKALDDPRSFPMVAVRTAGLGLSSVIGYADDTSSPEEIRSLVDEEYLTMMLALGSERFKANVERSARFGKEFRRSMSALQTPGRIGRNIGWEDKTLRAERKRQEGLARQRMKQQNTPLQSVSPDVGDLFTQSKYR